MTILSPFTRPHVFPNLCKFLYYAERIRRYFKEFWRTKQLLVPIDFHSREINTMEVNGDHQLFDYSILQNIFFYVQQKRETHTGLEQHEGE